MGTQKNSIRRITNGRQQQIAEGKIVILLISVCYLFVLCLWSFAGKIPPGIDKLVGPLCPLSRHLQFTKQYTKGAINVAKTTPVTFFCCKKTLKKGLQSRNKRMYIIERSHFKAEDDNQIAKAQSCTYLVCEHYFSRFYHMKKGNGYYLHSSVLISSTCP